MSSVNPDEAFFNQRKDSLPADEALKLEWAEDPGIIGGILTTQPPFPLEAMGPGLSDLCRSIQRLTGCNAAAAAQVLLGSLAVCAQADTDVRLPWTREAGDAVPVSLFLAGLVPTAGRKSACFSLAFRPHSEADSKIRALQKEAEAAHKAWAGAGKGTGKGKNGKAAGDVQGAEPPRPLSGPAYILRTNTTLEAIIRDLDQGRGCMALASAEAGSVIDNWSHGRNKGGTVASYNSLWSGESQTHDRTGDGGISRYLDGSQRFSLAFFCQSSYRSWFFDKATTNGFAGRLLIQCADDWCRRDVRAISREVTSADDAAACSFQRLIADWRQTMDDGAHLERDAEDSPPDRRVLRFAPEERQTIAAFEEECGDRADLLVDCPWPEGFLQRAPEHACRLAAILFAYRQLAEHVGPGDVIDAAALRDGMVLTRWFGEEMARIAPEAGADEVAQVGGALSKALWEASLDLDPKGRNKNGTVSISKAIKTRAGVRTLEERPEMRARVLQALVDADHIAFPKSGKLDPVLHQPQPVPDVPGGAVKRFWRKWRFGTLMGREIDR